MNNGNCSLTQGKNIEVGEMYCTFIVMIRKVQQAKFSIRNSRLSRSLTSTKKTTLGKIGGENKNDEALSKFNCAPVFEFSLVFLSELFEEGKLLEHTINIYIRNPRTQKCTGFRKFAKMNHMTFFLLTLLNRTKRSSELNSVSAIMVFLPEKGYLNALSLSTILLANALARLTQNSIEVS